MSPVRHERFPRGDTPTVRVRNAVDADKNPFPIADGWNVVVTARRFTNGPVVISRSIAGGDGVFVGQHGADIKLQPTDTNTLDIDRELDLIWDVQATKGTEVHTLGAGVWTVVADITR